LSAKPSMRAEFDAARDVLTATVAQRNAFAALLKETLAEMMERAPNKECDRCDGARGSHSLECRIRAALKAGGVL
jgi:hypothetical protein